LAEEVEGSVPGLVEVQSERLPEGTGEYHEHLNITTARCELAATYCRLKKMKVKYVCIENLCRKHFR
jgi:hypothetical protein